LIPNCQGLEIVGGSMNVTHEGEEKGPYGYGGARGRRAEEQRKTQVTETTSSFLAYEPRGL
jgi:hypothetical protein